MVSVTSEEQFYAVAQFAVPNSYVGDMYDSYEAELVVIVDADDWYYLSFEQSLGMTEEYGYPISFEEFEMRYLETVPTDSVMTHDDEVKAVSGVKYFRGTDADLEKIAQDMVNHPSHYKQFGREVIDTMQGMSTPEEFKGYLKLNAVKYLSRYQGKNGAEDLDKAIWYVTKLKEVLEEEK